MDNKLYTHLDFQTIEEQKEFGWPPEYCSSIGLVPYIRRLGPDITGLEVGTEKGESAYVILDKCPNVKKLYTMDHYESWLNWDGNVDNETQKKFKTIAETNLAQFGSRAEIIILHTFLFENIRDKIPEESLDFVYLDGDPDQEATEYDLGLAHKLLKPKGLLAGHNYQFDSVYTAVDRFRKRMGITSPVQKSTNGTYFWYKP